MIDLLSYDKVKLCAFDLSCLVCKSHDEMEWFKYARELKKELDATASISCIPDVDEIELNKIIRV